MGPVGNTLQRNTAAYLANTPPHVGQAGKIATLVHTKLPSGANIMQRSNAQVRQLSLAEHRAKSAVKDQVPSQPNNIHAPQATFRPRSLVAPQNLPSLPSPPSSAKAANTPTTPPVTKTNLSPIAQPVENRAKLCTAFLNALKPANVTREKWEKLENYVAEYTSKTVSIQGQPFENLLGHVMKEGKARQLMASFSANSKLPLEQHQKMLVQRDVWNIGNFDRPTKNIAMLGNEASYASLMAKQSPGKVPECLLPGNQLSVTMRTPIQTDAGHVVDITVVSCVAPALDSPTQPEFGAYVSLKQDKRGKPAQVLDKNAYAKSFECIRQQVLKAAAENPHIQTVALPAIGLDAFIGALGPAAKRDAIEVATDSLAKLARDLRKSGKTVSYMDVAPGNDIWTKVNEKLKARSQEPLPYAGKVPGDWITEGTMLLNAWDPHSLVGNKLAKDNSIDGFIGRNSLVHFMHALHCMAHAEGVKFDFGQASN